MTHQYGGDAGSRRAFVVAVLVLSCLVSAPAAAAAAAARLGAPSPTPSSTQAVRTTPEVQSTSALADKRISRPTGMVASTVHRGVLWMISGRTLFAVKTSGRTVGTYTFGGPAPLALESLAMTKDERGRPMLAMGDTGDPHLSRSKGVWLLMVREPERLGSGTLRPQRYHLEFPDGPQNARTLLVNPSDQRLYMVSMASAGGNVYALPAALGLGMTNVLTKVNPVHFVAQDGGFLPDGRVILRGRYQAHVLAAIGGRRLAYLQMPRDADGPIAVVPGGASILVAGSAPKSRLWLLRLPPLPAAPPTPGPQIDHTVKPAPVASSGPLSDRAVGMASLAGMAAIAILGGVLHLRRRSRVRAARHSPGSAGSPDAG